MTMNIQKMSRMQEDLYIPRVIQAFGAASAAQLKQLLESIIQVYRRLDPGLRTEPLVMFCEVTATSVTLPAVQCTLHDPDLLQHELDSACMVQVSGAASLSVRAFDAVAVTALSETAIVYRYHAGEEEFIVRGEVYRLPNPTKGYPSTFCKPTFTELMDALRAYEVRWARDSSCQLLKGAWFQESQRWYLKAKPEVIMRKSLTQFLSMVLQDAEVRPEQFVDETHPVDIKVTWLTSSLRAIIEIKWIGDSMDENGKAATKYRDSRALEGARQLAKYMDGSRTHGSSVRTRGYLVVFDGRRRGLSESMTALSHEHGMHYRDQHLTYDPDYNALRDDFEVPVRIFMNPICT